MLKNRKPFKTYRQQLSILRDRGLEVPTNGQPMRALEKIGYYTLINGYKALFLARDSKGNILHPEKFITGANFSEIVALYNFDKELRAILYTALLEYETNLGAELAYRFSEKFPEEHSYLAMDNFNASDITSVVGTISALSNTIKQKTNVGKKQQNAIKHYVNNHGHVPLWVLVNFLTFGELNYFYRNCIDDVRIEIAKDFSVKLRREYKGLYQTAITPDTIDAVDHMVNHFRNAVAHNEITYSKRLATGPSLKNIKMILNSPTMQLNSQPGVFELVVSLKLVLTKGEFKSLSKSIRELLKKYQPQFQSVSFEGILQDMNFPSDYEKFI